MSTDEPAGVREGQLVAGKYRIDRILGAGGMGVVVAAHHLDLDERVAIKFLLPNVLDHVDAVARFAREARAAVKIKSEHVARVTDVGRLENGSPYMVMEYLEGADLAALLREKGPLPCEQAIEFVLQACEAIAEAHALGIVHRDLKPSNLFVIRRPDGAFSVKVLDFGISKITNLGGSPHTATLTQTAGLMGSPFYMSPEQMESSRSVDSRCDLWALGVILYELITGTPPFVADTLPELVLRVVNGGPPAALSNRRGDAPDGLEAVILRCLEKDRTRRYESVGELARALLPFGPKRARNSVERISGVLRSAGLSASALALPASSAGATPAARTGTAASWGKTAPPRQRARWLAAGAGVVLVGLAAFAFGVLKSQGPISADSATAASSIVLHALPSGDAPPPLPSLSPVLTVSAAATQRVSVVPIGAPSAAVIGAASPSPSASVIGAVSTSPSGGITAHSPTRVKAPPVRPNVTIARAAMPAPAAKGPGIFDERK
jgi:serine/threonine-protein kinase